MLFSNAIFSDEGLTLETSAFLPFTVAVVLRRWESIAGNLVLTTGLPMEEK